MDPPTGKPYKEHRPTLYVDVTGPNGNRGTVKVLIDTGSPATIFDRSVADLLDIDVDAVEADCLFPTDVLGRREVRTVWQDVGLSLPPWDEQWTAEVGFLTDYLPLTFAGILGGRGFLDQWAVTFDLANRVFLVEQPGRIATG